MKGPKGDTIKIILTFGFAYSIMGMAFYGLVLYPLVLDPLVQGALIGWGSAAIAFVFAQEIAKQATAANQRAYDKGLATPAPSTVVAPPAGATTTTTVVSEPPLEPTSADFEPIP